MISIIVAHYNEDLKWLDSIDYHKVIYSKGENKIGISLPNIGRESHTYCHHIINNWNYLSEYTIFCQGNPFEHCKDFLNMISVPHGTLLAHDYFITDGRGCPQHCGLDIDRYKNLLIPQAEYPIRFCAGAQFMVHRDNIYKLGWEFWYSLLSYHYIDDNLPWIIERLWQKILLI